MPTESVVERFEQVERVSQYFIKGYTPLQISRELAIPLGQTRNLIEEYKKLISERVDEDPSFLERISNNTLKALDEMNMISKEAWGVYEQAKELEMVNQQTQTLKLAMDIAERKAKLVQLLGTRIETGNMANMQRLERVNEIVADIIKDIISGCEHCRIEAQVRLAEAFRLMDKQDEIVEMVPLPPADYEQEEDETQELNMEDVMGNILGNE